MAICGSRLGSAPSESSHFARKDGNVDEDAPSGSSGIAIFDFDGTITRRDTTQIMLRAAVSRRPLRGAVYMLALVFSRLFRTQKFFQRHKDILLFALLERMIDEEVAAVAASYRMRVGPLLRESMLARIKEYVESGIRVLVVTASPQFAVEKVFDKIPVLVIGAKVVSSRSGDREAGQGVVSCFGAQKVMRFQEWAERKGWQGEVSAAWSDSIRDLPLMQLAERRYWVGPGEKARMFEEVDPEGIFVEMDD